MFIYCFHAATFNQSFVTVSKVEQKSWNACVEGLYGAIADVEMCGHSSSWEV